MADCGTLINIILVFTLLSAMGACVAVGVMAYHVYEGFRLIRERNQELNETADEIAEEIRKARL